MRFLNYINESTSNLIKKWILNQINSYDEQSRPDKPIKDYVFRITSNKEYENLKRGYYSGSFWSSDPTEYMNYLENGSYLFVTKTTGVKKYRGQTKHYHNLETREIDEIEEIYKITGSKPNFKMEKIK